MHFNENDPLYKNVNEIAEREGLLWDGRYGAPYDLTTLIAKELQNETVTDEVGRFTPLFDHTIRFKPRGSGRKMPVLAVSSPYAWDDENLRSLVADFAALAGLEYRINDERDRIYTTEGTIPIAFWRPDLHKFKG